MVLACGFPQMAQHMKENGLEQKKMDKVSKLGLMDIFTMVDLKIVSGVDLGNFNFSKWCNLQRRMG